MSETTHKKKLIEVALPLDEINAACKADKDRKIGTIRNVHKWFAPMPLPAWRALLFAALIDDPEDDNQRVYLLDVIKRLVANGADLPDEDTIGEARALITKQFPQGVPTVMDPFCGGGTTLVEAQRLGLPAYGTDLNPVPVLVTRVLTELLPKARDLAPLHPEGNRESADDALFGGEPREYGPFDGLRADLAYYTDWVGKQAQTVLAPHFPSLAGETPIAWLWARTAHCVNPTCGIETVLTTSWWISRHEGNLAWIEPTAVNGKVHLEVIGDRVKGEAPEPPKIGRGANFACLGCGNVIDEDEIAAQGTSGKLGLRMTAVIAEVGKRRIYRQPTAQEIDAAVNVSDVEDLPEVGLPDIPRYIPGPRFGIKTQRDLYTRRQLLTMTTFADLVGKVPDEVLKDGGDEGRAKTIATLLGLAVGKLAQYGSSQNRLVTYKTSTTRFNGAFARNDIPMIWDFYEGNLFGNVGGTWNGLVSTMASAFPYVPAGGIGKSERSDARRTRLPVPGLVATDPPYFDAIGYADLSDYFYVWHRRALRGVHSDLYATIATPKSGELTAMPPHHGNNAQDARTYFIDGFTETFRNLQESQSSDLPMLVVYASKEQKGGREEETRWSSILRAMIAADMEITGTWPVHGTGSTRMRGIGANAVATYIVMTCRPRSDSAATSSLADFNRSLRRELGPAVRDLQAASILPVDLAQAAMGPGMQIFSRYRAVLDQSGKPVEVEQALGFINAALSEVLDEQEGELDPESRFAVRWWEAYGWDLADFGEADKTARPLGISVDQVKRAQVATSVGNKIQLLGIQNLDRGWTPSDDIKATAWEAVHHLADRLVDGGGELEASQLMAKLGQLQDPAMALTYRLHDIAARKGRTGDQERYNALINSWTELIRLSGDAAVAREGLF